MLSICQLVRGGGSKFLQEVTQIQYVCFIEFLFFKCFALLFHTSFEFHPQGFTLEFHFSPNEYFTDKVLTKSYEMRAEPDEEDPFSFEGPEIVACQGYVSYVISLYNSHWLIFLYVLVLGIISNLTFVPAAVAK